MNLFETTNIDFTYVGDYDNEGEFHGAGVFRIDEKKSCFRGVCKDQEYGKLSGWFEHGVLQGVIVLTSQDSYQITYANVKDGIVHSIVITTGLRANTYRGNIPKKKDLHPSSESMRQNGVARLARFVNGKLDGPVWLGLLGYPAPTQGFLYGKLNKKSQFTGDDLAYIYSFGRLALVGKFEDKYMKSARKANIVKAKCENSLLTLEFSEPTGPELYYDLPSNSSLGTTPLVRDPYEQMTIELQNSTVPVAGHGIFAIRDVKVGEVLAFYNGMEYVDEQVVN